ncbi:MAG TPA: peptide ABC transporter substrate-binding protein [Candidatus Dormibacteraeota bacterium]|nr:peptide ABC transporter substrate-binding protein [Candidatus Dormibacteraeota bacterium]
MRLLGALLSGLVLLAVCNPSTPPPPKEVLAPDQTLSFPIAQDVADFDPAQMSSPTDVDIFRNVFSGLYKFDQSLNEVPDLATGPATISADGLTFTFHVRPNALFSNGDPITADDFIYSWNRAAAKQGDFAGLFSLIAGYNAVAGGRTSTLSGLVKIDDFTFSTTLSKQAGYWPTLVGLWPFWVVDRKVIAAAGDNTWFTKPDTLIGSGPFHMTARAAGQSLDFEPVPAWYGGKTGALQRIHIDVLPDQLAQVTRYEAGGYSLIGYGRQSLPTAVAVHYATDPKLETQLQLVPAGLTYWIGFNLKTGPFAGVDAGRTGRHAFSAAIDRKALADALCSQGTTCTPATGGLISKGLAGYLGDGTDSAAKFDPVAAKAEYQAWDPKGTKVKGLTYTYDTNPFNKALCANLAAQWQQNLGVAVACTEVDRQDFFDNRNGRCAYSAFRQSWSADYNNPQNWFSYLFATGASSSGSCYSNPAFDTLVAQANAKPLTLGVLDYQAAGYMLVSDSVFGALVYGQQEYLAHPYVKGVGGNALYDSDWTLARILKH